MSRASLPDTRMISTAPARLPPAARLAYDLGWAASMEASSHHCCSRRASAGVLACCSCPAAPHLSQVMQLCLHRALLALLAAHQQHVRWWMACLVRVQNLQQKSRRCSSSKQPVMQYKLRLNAFYRTFTCIYCKLHISASSLALHGSSNAQRKHLEQLLPPRQSYFYVVHHGKALKVCKCIHYMPDIDHGVGVHVPASQPSLLAAAAPHAKIDTAGILSWKWWKIQFIIY